MFSRTAGQIRTEDENTDGELDPAIKPIPARLTLENENGEPITDENGEPIYL